MAQKKMSRENLVSLRMAFAALVRAGDDSLSRAYDLGQIVDALSNIYTYKVMGDAVDRSQGTIAKYRKLYGMYPTVRDLLDMAHKYETFDVSILTGSQESLAAKYGYRCGNCGSWDTHRVRRDDSVVTQIAKAGSKRRAAPATRFQH